MANVFSFGVANVVTLPVRAAKTAALVAKAAKIKKLFEAKKNYQFLKTAWISTQRVKKASDPLSLMSKLKAVGKAGAAKVDQFKNWGANGVLAAQDSKLGQKVGKVFESTKEIRETADELNKARKFVTKTKDFVSETPVPAQTERTSGNDAQQREQAAADKLAADRLARGIKMEQERDSRQVERTLRFINDIVSIADPTGILSVVGAYTHEVCDYN